MESSQESKANRGDPNISRQKLLRDWAASFVVSRTLEMSPMLAQGTI